MRIRSNYINIELIQAVTLRTVTTEIIDSSYGSRCINETEFKEQRIALTHMPDSKGPYCISGFRKYKQYPRNFDLIFMSENKEIESQRPIIEIMTEEEKEAIVVREDGSYLSKRNIRKIRQRVSSQFQMTEKKLPGAVTEWTF